MSSSYRSRPATAAVAFAAFLTLAAASNAPAPRTGVVESTFRGLILDRIRAYGRGDVAAYMAMLAPGFEHVSDVGERRTTAQMPAYVGNHGDNRARYTVASLTCRIEGHYAFVDAEVRERLPDTSNAFRETDVFTQRNGRWQYYRHHETPILQPPTAAVVSNDPLRAYIGRYKSAAGTIDIITVKNQTLYDRTLPSTDTTPLIQVARGAFGFVGDPTLAVFIHDASGTPNQVLWHLPSGQTVISIRER